jgi:uncharacterized protein
MPLFVMYGLDCPRGVEIRKETRPAHLEWIAGLGDRVKVAGGMLAEDGATPVGSMLIVEADDLAGAKEMLSEDPYRAAKLWDRIEVRQYNAVKI